MSFIHVVTCCNPQKNCPFRSFAGSPKANVLHPFPLHRGWDQLGGSGECLGAGEPIVGSYPVRPTQPGNTWDFGGGEFWLLEHWNNNVIVVIIVIHYIYIYQDCIDIMEWDPEVFYDSMFKVVLMAILKVLCFSKLMF